MIFIMMMLLAFVSQDGIDGSGLYGGPIKNLIEEIRERRKERADQEIESDLEKDKIEKDRKRNRPFWDGVAERWKNRTKIFNGSLLQGLKWIIWIAFAVVLTIVILKVRSYLQ